MKEGDGEEITHKLSERVALFIEHHSEKPNSVSKKVKKTYVNRGAAVHGKKVGDISEAVPFVEECVRLTLRKLALATAAGMNPNKLPDILEQAMLSKAPFTLDELIETANK